MISTENKTVKFNRTKIVATIGPKSNSKEMIKNLILAGVDLFRLNFSHGKHEEHKQVIDFINEINNELDSNIGILADLQGPKIRLGNNVENDEITLENDSIITLSTVEQTCTPNLLYITYEPLARDVTVGERILIDDGKIELQVQSTNGIDELQAKVIFGGKVRSRKGVNLPETQVSSPALTQKDIKDLEFILTQPVSWIALSFVRSAQDIERLKGMIQFKEHAARVVAKIEKPEALLCIDDIIRVSDAVMIARGDLGVEVPLENVPLIQKKIVAKCNAAAKPVIIATQIMESMIDNPAPTRAEITDVANAILDGADALMLSGETAMGKHPVRVIQTFEKIIQSVEKEPSIYNKDHLLSTSSPTYLSDAICYNACRLADSVDANAIIGMTQSGYTAYMVSSYRPQAAIFIFTANKSLLNSVSLIWGVRAFYYDSFNTTEKTMQEVKAILINKGLLQKGETVINIGTMPLHERGTANVIKISKIN